MSGRGPTGAGHHVCESLRILDVGDVKSRHFARRVIPLAERGREVHIASSRVNLRKGELDELHSVYSEDERQMVERLRDLGCE